MPVTIVDFELGRAIRRRRRMMGITQVDLAKHVGVGFQTIQKYECGEVALTVARLVSVAHGLHMKAADLIATVEDR